MRHLTFIIFLFNLSSCDPIYTAEIKNESTNHTILKVKFDSNELHKYWNDKTYIPFLKSYPNYENISAIDFDTVNLIKTYIIDPMDVFPLETGTSEPDFTIFKKIIITNSDTLILNNRDEIIHAFKKIDSRNWVLTIK